MFCQISKLHVDEINLISIIDSFNVWYFLVCIVTSKLQYWILDRNLMTT